MYRFFRFSCALAIAALTLVQCTKDLTDISVGEPAQNASATKIINTSRSAMAGTLLVKFNEEGAFAFENGTRSGNGVTRSNIAPLNEILLDIDAVSIERLFPVDVRNEEATRKAGLHRWYIVHFDKEQTLDNVAQAVAKIGEVQFVQFNTQMTFTCPVKLGNGSVSQSGNSSTRLTTPQFNDPQAGMQWDLHNTGNKQISQYAVAGMDINAHEAWKYTTGDPSIVVAVIDQGVDYTHEDLKANMWVNEDEIPDNGIDDDRNGYVDDVHGYNFVTNGPISWNIDTDPIWDNLNSSWKYGDIGHGTHIAGTIAAVNNNGIGISGIAGGDGTPNSGVKIMSVQVFSGRNENNTSTAVLAAAFKYAADNGAVLANNSWATKPIKGQNDSWYHSIYGTVINTMEYFKSKSNHPNIDGGIFIFAAGNDSTEQASYPSAYRDFISVTSYAINGMPAYYTNYGPGCNISAPGGDQSQGIAASILSTQSSIYPEAHQDYTSNKNYAWMQGTSMACPHATGVAALGIAYAKKIGKKLSADEFNTKFLLSVNGMDSEMENPSYSKYVGKMGTGRLDAFKLLMNIEGITCIRVPRGVQYYSIDINKYIGDGKTNIKCCEMEISAKDMERLGINSKPRYMTNTFRITCEKTGSAIVTVKMIAGGENAGTTDQIGGKTISKKFALVVRDNFADNGGWL
jgi:hypothetical protein